MFGADVLSMYKGDDNDAEGERKLVELISTSFNI